MLAKAAFVAVALVAIFFDGPAGNSLQGKSAVAQVNSSDRTSAEYAAKQSIIERLGKLRNVSIAFKSNESYTPMPGLKERVEAANKPGARTVSRIRTEPCNLDCKFRYLDGKYWYETTLIQDDLAANLPNYFYQHRIDCSFGEGYERYYRSLNNRDGIGDIEPSPAKVMLYPPQSIDLGLGVRPFEDFAFEWLTPEEFGKMSIEIKPDGIVELARPGINGNKLHAWQFDPSQGYALRKYTVSSTDSKLKNLEVLASNFKTEGDLVLPHYVELRRFGPGEVDEQPVIQQDTLDKIIYELNSSDNTEESYHITWPLGTRILHEKSGKTIRIKTRPQILEGKYLEEILSRPVTPPKPQP
jgi:hypothetical protein